MKLAIFAGGLALLALGACQDMTLPGVSAPVTAAQQQCVAVEAVTAVKGANFKAMSTEQKLAFAAGQVDAIGADCGVTLTPTVQGWIKTAVLLAGV